MAATYDARIWNIEVYKGKRTTSYIVWWRVGERRFKERFKTRALADSFRSELVAAARKGEAFDADTGRPVSMGWTIREMGWYDFACAYMDAKWPAAAATYRRSLSEALTAITPALLTSADGGPDPVLMRRALHRWAFNFRCRPSRGRGRIRGRCPEAAGGAVRRE
jgi:hypothetical protein